MPLYLVLPALFLVFAVHFAAPITGGWYSLTDWNGTTARYIGFSNFQEIFESAGARGALINTLKLAFSFLIIVNLTGLLFALGLNRRVKSRLFLRSILFIPAVASPVAVAYVWQFIFDSQGPLNHVLGAVGLSDWQRVWLADPTWSLWTVLVVLVWQYSGLTMVFYLAGLQSIPEDLFDAAEMDGAGPWMTFRSVVLPLLAPAITMSMTLTIIFGLRVFDQVVALTGGGPVEASETLATQVWKQTFVAGRFGYGTALAVILTALILIAAIAQLLVLRRYEHRM